MKKICVIGSLNVDLTIRLPRFHAPGETITGTDFYTYSGGKGGNQAVAAAKLGASVLMVGNLGEDSNGAFYREVLRTNGVDESGVRSVADVPSGIALIEVDAHGENRIAIVPGTNALVDRAQIDELLPRLLEYDIFLMQLEIPLDTVTYAAKLLSEHGKCVILDPAPAVPLPEELYSYVRYLTPNSTELSILSGLPTASLEQAERACRCLIERGANGLIAKLGALGCMLVDDGHATEHVPGYKVDVVDTTAAGDSFNAGLAVALARDSDISSALMFANAVGALSITGEGAQSAMPTMSQVEAFIRVHKSIEANGAM